MGRQSNDKACRSFVLGAGVAGLQAIATAKRLGASVKAADIRADAVNRPKPWSKDRRDGCSQRRSR